MEGRALCQLEEGLETRENGGQTSQQPNHHGRATRYPVLIGEGAAADDSGQDDHRDAEQVVPALESRGLQVVCRLGGIDPLAPVQEERLRLGSPAGFNLACVAAPFRDLHGLPPSADLNPSINPMVPQQRNIAHPIMPTPSARVRVHIGYDTSSPSGSHRRHSSIYRILTARAASTTITVNEIMAWTIISTLAQ